MSSVISVLPDSLMIVMPARVRGSDTVLSISAYRTGSLRAEDVSIVKRLSTFLYPAGALISLA